MALYAYGFFLRCYGIKEKNQIIKCLYDIYNIYLNGSDMFEYDVSILITMIWRQLVKSLSEIDFIPTKRCRKTRTVQVMLVYIHTHYADELSLKDIADAGMMKYCAV